MHPTTPAASEAAALLDLGAAPASAATLAARRRLAAPGTLGLVVDHIGNGGSLVTLAEAWDVPFQALRRWIREDAARAAAYADALQDGQDWARTRVLDALREAGEASVLDAFTPDGRLRPLGQIPAKVARAISALETDGMGGGRVRMVDKLKALELTGKALGVFVDRVQVEHRATLEDLVLGAQALGATGRAEHLALPLPVVVEAGATGSVPPGPEGLPVDARLGGPDPTPPPGVFGSDAPPPTPLSPPPQNLNPTPPSEKIS